jgi:hypothetical protein
MVIAPIVFARSGAMIRAQRCMSQIISPLSVSSRTIAEPDPASW